MSPYLTKCCLRASATVSYQNAERDLHFYTGIKVSSKTHQRLVHRYKFPEEICNEKLEEISVDGGKVRLRNPTQGESCIWKDYKAICANQTLKVENLYKVGGSTKRLKKAKALLWQGKVDETLALIFPLTRKQAQNFCRYLETHRTRIINYDYYQQEGICSIASGAVESTVKQIDRRLKISGAQWNPENIPQVLKHRCAYLNNSF